MCTASFTTNFLQNATIVLLMDTDGWELPDLVNNARAIITLKFTELGSIHMCY